MKKADEVKLKIEKITELLNRTTRSYPYKLYLKGVLDGLNWVLEKGEIRTRDG